MGPLKSPAASPTPIQTEGTALAGCCNILSPIWRAACARSRARSSNRNPNFEKAGGVGTGTTAQAWSPRRAVGDFVVASDDLRIGFPEVRRGLVAALRRQVPEHWRRTLPLPLAASGYGVLLGLGFATFVLTLAFWALTAIVLSGAAGLKLGHSLLAPGRRTRRQSLVHAARECVVLVYGVTAMLVVAAAIEAFWSSAIWLPNAVKYSAAAVCWIVVLIYLSLQGRHAA